MMWRFILSDEYELPGGNVAFVKICQGISHGAVGIINYQCHTAHNSPQMSFDEQHQNMNEGGINPASELCKPLLGGPGTRQSLLVDIKTIRKTIISPRQPSIYVKLFEKFTICIL